MDNRKWILGCNMNIILVFTFNYRAVICPRLYSTYDECPDFFLKLQINSIVQNIFMQIIFNRIC